MGNFTFSATRPLRLRDEARDIAPRRIARHRLPPPRAVVLNDVAPGGEKHVGEFPQRKARALGVGEHQIADILRAAAALFIQHHRQFEDFVPFENLRGIRALESRLHRFQHLHRTKTKLRQPLGLEPHHDALRAGRRLQLHVRRARKWI